MSSRHCRCSALRQLCTLALLIVVVSATTERERNFPDLYKFPYSGRGDPKLSFHHPFEPDDDGDPVSGWLQLGTTIVTADTHGRDLIRLTAPAQANQGLFYAYTKTRTSDFNGWFDIQINTSPDSHEPADGMALFFTSQRPIIGSAMGMSHTLPGLGIVIDTFSNSRTRMTPYMYAYVSDGHRTWNPDTDGSDTELAKGCHLELNKPTRVFVRFVDRKLDVGVSFTPHSPDRWHSCFSVDHVALPFADGGYLAFAGETGHFFAAHDVLAAGFVAEHAHNRRPDDEYQRRELDARDREQREHDERARRERDDAERRAREQREQREHAEHLERVSREQDDARRRDVQERQRRQRDERSSSAVDATGQLAGSLDRQVGEVFMSLTEHMRGYTDRDAEETRARLNGVRDLTTHVLQEVGRQRSEMQKVVEHLSHLRESANGLHYATTKFNNHLRSMQASVKTLRERTRDLHDSHDDIQDSLEQHQHSIHSLRSKQHADSPFLVLFGVLQVVLMAAAFAYHKLRSASRKVGRMV